MIGLGQIHGTALICMSLAFVVLMWAGVGLVVATVGAPVLVCGAAIVTRGVANRRKLPELIAGAALHLGRLIDRLEDLLPPTGNDFTTC